MEDRDQMMAYHIKELFLADGGTSEVTREDFTEKMKSNVMQDYFRALDVRPSEASKLFELLDVDGGGTVSAEEIVSGCMSLRGTAKGLDMRVLLQEIAHVQDELRCIHDTLY